MIMSLFIITLNFFKKTLVRVKCLKSAIFYKKSSIRKTEEKIQQFFSRMLLSKDTGVKWAWI